MSEDFILLFSLFAGVAGAVLSGWLPASGKVALAVGLTPLAGYALGMAFC